MTATPTTITKTADGGYKGHGRGETFRLEQTYIEGYGAGWYLVPLTGVYPRLHLEPTLEDARWWLACEGVRVEHRNAWKPWELHIPGRHDPVATFETEWDAWRYYNENF